jgi:hypothetical protein
MIFAVCISHVFFPVAMFIGAYKWLFIVFQECAIIIWHDICQSYDLGLIFDFFETIQNNLWFVVIQPNKIYPTKALHQEFSPSQSSFTLDYIFIYTCDLTWYHIKFLWFKDGLTIDVTSSFCDLRMA